MKAFILALTSAALMGSAYAASEVSSQSLNITVTDSAKVEVKVIETSEACAFTFDPQWADDEDTSGIKVIFDNYKATTAKLESLRKAGFEFAGYEGNEKCTFENGANTFPALRASDGSLYFSVYTTGASLASAAREQNAFKTVRRIYVKGFEELKKSVLKKVDLKKFEVLSNL